jgi:sporulation protein YunB
METTGAFMKPLFKPKRRATGRKPGRKWLLLFIFFSLALGLGYAYYRFDRQVVPLALSMAEVNAKTEINGIIHSQIQAIIQERSLGAQDFYMTGDDHTVTVNTVLVNEICNAVAAGVSDKLSQLNPQPVSVPLGMALGLDTLAYFGPRISFNLSPVGNALADYESRFESVGINQVHFEVWLTVESTVRIINPVQSASVTVSRDVALVDTMVSGAVPDTYLNVNGAQGFSKP